MDLREILLGSLGRHVEKQALIKLIHKCHSMALAYLRMKASSNKLYMIQGERLEDLAWDFIAELFERDDDGCLIKIQEYFEELNLEELDNSDLIIEIRKLVFTKVEDNIFRAFGEKDPSLRKIIRNLKLAVRDSNCSYRVCFKQGYIIVDSDDENGLPIMPSEVMQIRLSQRLEEKMQIPEILTETIDVLQRQDRYQKRISLVSLASVIRMTFVHFHETATSKNKLQADDAIISSDFEKFLDKSIEEVRTSTGYSYARNGKVSHDDLNLYMKAVREIVYDHFSEGKTEASQFEYLRNYMPDLEYSVYRTNNRQILEYLVKLVRKNIIETYKQDWV